MRLCLALLTFLVAMPALAQTPAAQPIAIRPCIATTEDGRQTLPGFHFAAVVENRLALLVVRRRDAPTEATDFIPVPTVTNGSYFMQNYEVRIGDRPRSLFLHATVRDDGTILIERWLRDDARPPEFGWHTLRCTP